MLYAGCEINTSCIKAIKSSYSACKGSKTTRKIGINEFLDVELEAGQEEAADVSRQREQTAEESCHQRSRSLVVKHARSQPAEAGSSQKRTRLEPEAEIPSKKILISEIELESAHVDLDEDPSAQLCSKSYRA